MLRLVIVKELKDIILSTKFAVTFGVCAVLILLSFAVGLKNYQAAAARYEAEKAENLKQLEGLTDWLRVRETRIFLPPDPLASLVTGVSNDISRTTEVKGRSALVADESPFNDQPLFAVFRFVDLEFIFQVVLSLFAILFAYDAVNGEKERGTLRLSFAGSLPRDVFITGKVLGAFLALAVPLLLPMVLGFLLIPMMGVPMSADSWVRLTLIIVAGLMYLGVFVTLSVAVSAITVRSSSSFLTLLVIWICAVLIIPRASVLIAGRAVEVPSADDVASQEARLNAQLWKEDRDKMSAYTATPGGDAQKMLGEFQKFMADIADARQKKMDELSSRLNEERTNRQIGRERFAFGLARISPSSTFSLAAMTLAGTGLNLKQHFRDAAQAYQTTFAKFITEKTGVNPGGGLVFRVVTSDNEKPRAIDPKELPEFTYVPMTLAGVFPGTVLDFGLLAAFMVVFFAVAFVAFLHYDLR